MVKEYKVWPHGIDDWKWSEDCKCYYQQKSIFQPPSAYCLGDRYIYNQAGLDSYGIIWRGSSSEDWGGSHFGYDLGKAIRWVKNTLVPEYECKLWSKPNGRDYIK